MKSVRIFYKKGGRMRFMSHLDMNRFMIRAINRAALPIWYTEGFNPHPYITFALPLSLGFNTECDCLDIRLTDDNFPLSEISKRLNEVTPEYIEFFEASEPLKKLSEVAFCEYEIVFDDKGEAEKELKEFLNSQSIICEKKTKKGDIKQLELKDKISSFKISSLNGDTLLSITLPASPNENINPEILLKAFFKDRNYHCYIITRKRILDKNFDKFR